VAGGRAAGTGRADVADAGRGTGAREDRPQTGRLVAAAAHGRRNRRAVRLRERERGRSQRHQEQPEERLAHTPPPSCVSEAELFCESRSTRLVRRMTLFEWL